MFTHNLSSFQSSAFPDDFLSFPPSPPSPPPSPLPLIYSDNDSFLQKDSFSLSDPSLFSSFPPSLPHSPFRFSAPQPFSPPPSPPPLPSIYSDNDSFLQKDSFSLSDPSLFSSFPPSLPHSPFRFSAPQPFSPLPSPSPSFSLTPAVQPCPIPGKQKPIKNTKVPSGAATIDPEDLMLVNPADLPKIKALQKAIFSKKGKGPHPSKSFFAISERHYLGSGLGGGGQINGEAYRIIFCGLSRGLDFQIAEIAKDCLSPVVLDLAPEGSSIRLVYQPDQDVHQIQFSDSPTHPLSRRVTLGTPVMSLRNGAVHAIRINGEDVLIRRIYEILKDALENAKSFSIRKKMAFILKKLKFLNLPKEILSQSINQASPEDALVAQVPHPSPIPRVQKRKPDESESPVQAKRQMAISVGEQERLLTEEAYTLLINRIITFQICLINNYVHIVDTRLINHPGIYSPLPLGASKNLFSAGDSQAAATILKMDSEFVVSIVKKNLASGAFPRI